MHLRMLCDPEAGLLPKHHYLSHYPWLITQFGPLIRVWTLRFESKHAYFKKVARQKQNFINISKTLCESHQMLQAYLHSTSKLFHSDICNEKPYRDTCPDWVMKILSVPSPAAFREINFRGTDYCLDQYLFLSRKGFIWMSEKLGWLRCCKESQFFCFNVCRWIYV